MKTQADNTQEPQTLITPKVTNEPSNGGTAQLVDNRTATIDQQKLKATMNTATENRATPIQQKVNKTGLPNNLKSGIENLSGYSMDDVKVHYNSSKPAQLQAHAYAQGTDIHLGPGQQKHLPHEAWHVVQQKQGRVKPTKQLKSKVNINDDARLEKEADVMGAKAESLEGVGSVSRNMKSNKGAKTYQLKEMDNETHTKKILRDMYPELVLLLAEYDELNASTEAQQHKIRMLRIKKSRKRFFKMGSEIDLFFAKRNLKSKQNKASEALDSIFWFIYGSLGKEDNDTYTSTPINKESMDNINYHAQNKKPSKKAYETGTYFHVRGNRGKNANERIILNIKNQNDAKKLVDHIKEGVENPEKVTLKTFAVKHDMVWTKKIKSLKFYASQEQKNKVKYDKVVIYFEGTPSDREAIRAGIKRFFNYELLKKDVFNEDISAFYNKMDKGIGYGKEIKGTSFTSESTKSLLDLALKGMNHFTDADDFAEKIYDYVNENRD
ncbi:DUF4157 domain-containing protein [Aquimarina sp. AD10]|uniref:eCIS core domain-containing protein n=1 Tax=Aquimarina sp. AD10 TaxID=1714849 RepID=UPI000E5371B0|nr:DUF4157 domain-containing protein [Aquimarina sp. AD10]AXT61388.1 DUF4157 domain-containing protein [Aquimarina sp. AD10]RKN01418.1 DUF4157 domain-containing protein [Aquimarina sp. AD10]